MWGARWLTGDLPLRPGKWYVWLVSGTSIAVMGDRGRLVVPAAVRQRQGWEADTQLVFVESEGGVVVLTREQLHKRVSRGLSGPSLADELILERRAEAER